MPIDNIPVNAVGALKPFVLIKDKNIVLDRAPTIYDQAEIGTITTNPKTQISYILQAVIDGFFIWNEISAGNGSGGGGGGGGGGSSIKFQAYLSADIPDVTGDETYYNMVCDTEIIDTSNNYDNTTGVFTAPVTGFYLFNCTHGTYNSSVDLISSWWLYTKLIINTNEYILSEGIVSQGQSSEGLEPHTINNSINIQLNAGDTVRLSVAARIPGGGSISIGFKGLSGSIYRTMFSGELTSASSPSTQSKFSAYLNTNIPSGPALTPMTVIFNTVLFDSNSEYNSVTGVYTALNAGLYQFVCGLGIISSTTPTAPQSPRVTLVTTSGSYILHQSQGDTPWYNGSLNTAFNTFGCSLVEMSIGDTAHIELMYTDSVGMPNIVGTASPYTTYFSGKLLN